MVMVESGAHCVFLPQMRHPEKKARDFKSAPPSANLITMMMRC
jgi:hypothetical protein